MRLKYHKFGAAGPELIVLHGLLGSSQNWRSTARMLADHARVIVPDLRNHGDSPHGEHRFDLITEDILELFDGAEIGRAFLLGHSMGGLAVMNFAFAHPQRLRGIIIVDIAPGAPMSDMSDIFQALLNLDLPKLQSREEADRQMASTIKSAGVRQFLLQNLKRQRDGGFHWRCNLPELKRFIQDRERFKIEDHQKYEGRTLFVAGGRSEYRVWEKEEAIRQHFPAAQLAVIPEAGHWVHFEAMSEFVNVVANFISTS